MGFSSRGIPLKNTQWAWMSWIFVFRAHSKVGNWGVWGGVMSGESSKRVLYFMHFWQLLFVDFNIKKWVVGPDIIMSANHAYYVGKISVCALPPKKVCCCILIMYARTWKIQVGSRAPLTFSNFLTYFAINPQNIFIVSNNF